jgi:hypothetical protein
LLGVIQTCSPTPSRGGRRRPRIVGVRSSHRITHIA